MRISDWSSDVCSSDLAFGRPIGAGQRRDHQLALVIDFHHGREPEGIDGQKVRGRSIAGDIMAGHRARMFGRHFGIDSRCGVRACIGCRKITVGELLEERSEEHTSELQSLMRISYAVFCLKKKQHKNTSKMT